MITRLLLLPLMLTGPEPTLPGVNYIELDGYLLKPNVVYSDPRPLGPIRIVAHLQTGATFTLQLKNPIARRIWLDVSELAGSTCVYEWSCAASLTPGDFDQDGDADQADFGFIQRCISGAGVRMSADCMAADLDRDADVDRDDVAAFTKRMTGVTP